MKIYGSKNVKQNFQNFQFDILIIPGSYGGHRQHTTDVGWRKTDNVRGMM